MNKETIKIFIASSAELEHDRKAFREKLSVKNDRLHYKGLYFELVQWEYFFNAISQTGKQDDYNQKLKECDIVICLFYKKAGKYTQLEFDTALKQFHETGTPLIYTYFKEPEVPPVEEEILDAAAEQSKQDLLAFKNRLGEIGHFYTRYINIDNLENQFSKQLDMLKDQGYEKLQENVKRETENAVVKYINSINIAKVQGDNNIVIQGVTDSMITVNVNGKTEEILNELGAMKEMLEKLNIKSFQADDKQYDINGIDKSNFAFVIGRAGQSKNIPEDLKEENLSKNSKWFRGLEQELKKFQVKYDGTPFTTFAHFGWLIEAYLLKYMASSVDNEQGLRSLSLLAEVYQSSLRFLCFIQLSQIFKFGKKVRHPAINEFIKPDKSNAYSFDYSNLLIVCTELLNEAEPFVPELNGFVKNLADTNSDIFKTNLFLENIRRKVLENTIPEDGHLGVLLDEYLAGIVFWLKKLSFISKYKMVSIKEIKLEYRLGTPVQYEHSYGELDGNYIKEKPAEKDNKDDNYIPKISLEGVYTYNQSILLLKSKYVAAGLENIGANDSFISLSPLVIDLSVYDEKPKDTPEIFLFAGMDTKKRQYNYTHFRNEIPINLVEPATNNVIKVLETNTETATLDKLFMDLEDILNPYKSNDK